MVLLLAALSCNYTVCERCKNAKTKTTLNKFLMPEKIARLVGKQLLNGIEIVYQPILLCIMRNGENCPIQCISENLKDEANYTLHVNLLIVTATKCIITDSNAIGEERRRFFETDLYSIF